MGDLIAGIAGAVLFTAVILGLIYAVACLSRRAAARAARRDTYDNAGGRWETAIITEEDITRVVVRRVADTRHGRRVLEQITVAIINATSPTWTQDVLNAQAEAEQRLAAIRATDQRGPWPRW